MMAKSKYWSHPTFDVNQTVRRATEEQLKHVLEAAAEARLGHAVKVVEELRRDHTTAGEAFAIEDTQSPARWLAMGTVNDTVYRQGSRRTLALNPKQAQRLMEGWVPVRWFGGNWNRQRGKRAEDAPMSDSQARQVLYGEDPIWDLYFTGWREPGKRRILELGIYDAGMLRELVKAHGPDTVFPPETASTNPDGTVKRYFRPAELQDRYGVQLIWAANFRYAGEHWRGTVVQSRALKPQPLLPKKQRRAKKPEPAPPGGLLSSDEA